MAEGQGCPWLQPFVPCSSVNGERLVLSAGTEIQAETSEEANRLVPEPLCPLSLGLASWGLLPTDPLQVQQRSGSAWGQAAGAHAEMLSTWPRLAISRALSCTCIPGQANLTQQAWGNISLEDHLCNKSTVLERRPRPLGTRAGSGHHGRAHTPGEAQREPKSQPGKGAVFWKKQPPQNPHHSSLSRPSGSSGPLAWHAGRSRLEAGKKQRASRFYLDLPGLLCTVF